MYYPSAARVQQFQANFLRKMAAADSPTAQKQQNQQGQQISEEELARLTNLGNSMDDAVQQSLWNKKLEEDPAMRAQYNKLIGGFVGNRYNQTLAGSLVGGLGGAALAGAGKYAYDKYRANREAVG